MHINRPIFCNNNYIKAITWQMISIIFLINAVISCGLDLYRTCMTVQKGMYDCTKFLILNTTTAYNNEKIFSIVFEDAFLHILSFQLVLGRLLLCIPSIPLTFLSCYNWPWALWEIPPTKDNKDAIKIYVSELESGFITNESQHFQTS